MLLPSVGGNPEASGLMSGQIESPAALSGATNSKRKVPAIKTYKRNEGAAARNRRELALLQQQADSMQQHVERLQLDQQSLQTRALVLDTSLWARRCLEHSLRRQQQRQGPPSPAQAPRSAAIVRMLLKPLVQSTLDDPVVGYGPPHAGTSGTLESLLMDATSPSPGLEVPTFSFQEVVQFWSFAVNDLSAALLELRAAVHGPKLIDTVKRLCEELRLCCEWQWLQHQHVMPLLAVNFKTGRNEEPPAQHAQAVEAALQLTGDQRQAIAAAREMFVQAMETLSQFQLDSADGVTRCPITRFMNRVLSRIASLGTSFVGAAATQQFVQMPGVAALGRAARLGTRGLARQSPCCSSAPGPAGWSSSSDPRLPLQSAPGPPGSVTLQAAASCPAALPAVHPHLQVHMSDSLPDYGARSVDGHDLAVLQQLLAEGQHAPPMSEQGVKPEVQGQWDMVASSSSFGGPPLQGQLHSADGGKSPAEDCPRAQGAAVPLPPSPALATDVAAALGESMEQQHYEFVVFVLVLTRGILTPEQEAWAYVRSFPWMPDWLAISELAARNPPPM